jgi:hypothetical protein
MSRLPPDQLEPPLLDDDRGDEPLYLEISVLLRQIDPAVSPDGRASEATRDEINSLNNTVLDDEPARPQPNSIAVANDRSKLLESQLATELDDSLRKLAEDWKEASRKLLAGAGAHVLERTAQITLDASIAAKLATDRALANLHGIWEKYGVTKEEIVKDIQKKAVWVVIAYAAIKIYTGATS